MGDKFLNEGCIFKCSNCAAVRIKPKEVMVHRTKFEGKTALTSSTQMILITPGYCKNLPQNPSGAPNCVTPLIQGNWTDVSRHTIGGKELLLETSKFKCYLGGGTIEVETNGVKKEINEKRSEFVLNPVIIKESSSKISRNKDNINPTGKGLPERPTTEGRNKEKDKEKNKKKEVEGHEAIEDLYCPYNADKPKCRECAYVLADVKHMETAQRPGSSKQPCVILRGNYEQEFNQLGNTRNGYRRKFLSVEEEYGIFDKINCGNAAHHILSTKDVYEQDKLRFVLKLANFYGYDVNESYNCIILPGVNASEERSKGELHVKFGSMSDYEKRKFKYFSMRESGRQWHGGGHGRDFENEHNISCYATQVADLLYSYMRKETKRHCRIDKAYYEQDKERFEKTIHKVIDIVRERLISFENKPQNSLPYFVSADAYGYAFKALNIRLLVFRKVENGLEVYKYVITRKNGKIFPDMRAQNVFDLEKKLSEKQLVFFCEQIDFAYVDIGNGEVSLPFTVANVININLNGISVDDYFRCNISAVEAEAFGMDSLGREKVLKSRLSELKGG